MEARDPVLGRSTTLAPQQGARLVRKSPTRRHASTQSIGETRLWTLEVPRRDRPADVRKDALPECVPAGIGNGPSRHPLVRALP